MYYKSSILSPGLCLIIVLMCMVSFVYAATAEEQLRQLEQLAELQRSGGNPEGLTANNKAEFNQDTPRTSITVLGESDPVRIEAYEEMLDDAFPFTQEQIKYLRKVYDGSMKAASEMPGVPPKPTSNSQVVRLDPGTTPPVIRLAKGFVSALVFLDSTGAAWPIDAYDIGDPNAFSVQWDKKGNTLFVQSNVLYKTGNIAVQLAGLTTPIMLTLIPGQSAVDYRIDLRVQGFGLNAKAIPFGDGLPMKESTVLLDILDGVAPKGSKTLNVSGIDGVQAWTVSGNMYVRTRHTLISPGWHASLKSADGMKAYEMNRTSLLLLSYHGQIRKAKIEG